MRDDEQVCRNRPVPLPRSRWGQRLAAMAALIAGLVGTPASAAVLLNVSGVPQDTGIALGEGQAAAIGFTLLQNVTNLTITAPLTCALCSGSPVGSLSLQRNAIGSAAINADIVDLQAFNNFVIPPVFSLASLAAGDYFFIVSVIDDGNSSTSRSVIWSGSSAEGTSGSGATRRGGNATDLTWAASAVPAVPAFDTEFDNANSLTLGLQYTIAGDLPGVDPPPTNNVPEPNMLGLLVVLTGLGALTRTMRPAQQPLRATAL